MADDATPIEPPLVKTKIIATVGPACADVGALRELVLAGVDVFRLNFAHGTHDWLDGGLKSIREIEQELDRPRFPVASCCARKGPRWSSCEARSPMRHRN